MAYAYVDVTVCVVVEIDKNSSLDSLKKAAEEKLIEDGNTGYLFFQPSNVTTIFTNDGTPLPGWQIEEDLEKVKSHLGS